MKWLDRWIVRQARKILERDEISIEAVSASKNAITSDSHRSEEHTSELQSH